MWTENSLGQIDSVEVPYMNKTLKQAVYKKRMLFNKYQNHNSSSNWEKFRQQRNLVTKLKRKSINQYFIERCVGGCKAKDFWPTVKPFLSNKSNYVLKDTILLENDKLINDQQEVCDIFNNFFVNVAKNIGDNSVPINSEHPSLLKIQENLTVQSVLNFKPVDEDFVSKQIGRLNVKKATGHDGISAKVLKLARPVIVKPLTDLINLTIERSEFPDSTKNAMVTPLHKKNSNLDKENYRPVSILPVVSKIYERAINEQLSEFFSQHFNVYLSAFRPGYGCQSTLLRIIEDWKQALDEKKYVAAILMDLSKAFDCLSHDLLLLKLKAYGVSENAVKLLKSYLTNRKQCVKLGTFKSDFQPILKGVPQGSILGPVLFNIFLNDIFHVIKNCKLYNYADDNTVSAADHDLSKLVSNLVEDSLRLIKWFAENHMKANPDKFQALAVGKHTMDENITFNLENNVINCEEHVKLLGVTIDFKLNFNLHISNVCKKASRQLNVLKRIGRNLCRLGKLNVYYSFIMSNFNYCPLVWHFCGEVNTKKIEKI